MNTKNIAQIAGIIGIAFVTGVAGHAGAQLWDDVLGEKVYLLAKKIKTKRQPKKSYGPGIIQFKKG